MMNRNIKIFLCTMAVILLSTGCSQIYDDSKTICNKEQPISIIATIDNANFRPIAHTRALETDNNSWLPEYVDAEEYERDVKHVFLFVYKKGELKPHKVIFYFNNQFGDNPLTAAAAAAVKVETMTIDANSLQMNLELYAGTYNFVLLVNSKAALEAINKNQSIHPEQLVEENTILTSDDLKGTDRQFLPMVGQSELVVPTGKVGSETDRVPLVPDIKLERVHARVEFILTTAKEDGKEYLSPILPLSKVTSLTLVNEQKKYTVMPSNKDYTVTGGGQISPLRATALTEGTPMTRGDVSYHQGANNADGKIAMFKDRLLPSNAEGKTLKYIYVAPSTIAAEIKDCLRLDFKVDFINDSNSEVYRIPLRNLEKDLPESKQFITRRNTIYRINAKLIGRDLSVLDYEVINWTNQDVDIPW